MGFNSGFKGLMEQSVKIWAFSTAFALSAFQGKLLAVMTGHYQ
jgi:hypothetical protein